MGDMLEYARRYYDPECRITADHTDELNSSNDVTHVFRWLVDEVDRLTRLRAWDERPETLPGGLVLEHGRLDRAWQILVQENDRLRTQLAEATRNAGGVRCGAAISS